MPLEMDDLEDLDYLLQLPCAYNFFGLRGARIISLACKVRLPKRWVVAPHLLLEHRDTSMHCYL